MLIDNLRGLAVEAIGYFAVISEIAPFRQCGQFIRNPAEPMRIASESNPKRVIEGLFPVHTPDRPSHDALRIRFAIDMSLLLIHHWNYGLTAFTLLAGGHTFHLLRS